MPIGAKKTKTSKTAKLRRQLKSNHNAYSAKMAEVDAFRKKHRKILDQLATLESEAEGLFADTKATATDLARESKKGVHQVLGGFRVSVAYFHKRSIDAAKLYKANPKLIEEWPGAFSVSVKQFDAAKSAGVIHKLPKGTVVETPATRVDIVREE